MANSFYIIVVLFLVSSCLNQGETILPPEHPISIVDSIHVEDIGLITVGDFLRSKDGYYMLDRATNVLVKTDTAFSIVQRYSKIGRGPFELQRPLSITLSENYVYLIDSNPRKIVRFDLSLNPIDELILENPPFSILALNDSILWMGSLHSEYEDVYQINMNSGSYTRHGKSRKINIMPEGIVFLASNKNRHVIRYRPFGNFIELFRNGSFVTSFANSSQASMPEIDSESPAPMFKNKTHNSAFLTDSLACFLSGDFKPRHQPIQCFDFSGTLVSRYVIPTISPFSIYADSSLYTYSPETNHIYVYDLGF